VPQDEPTADSPRDSPSDVDNASCGEIEIDEADLIAKAESLDEIVAQGKLVDELKRQTEAAQNAYKAKKNEWEAQVNRLTSLIRKSAEKLPLFDRTPEPTEDGDEDDDAWRNEPLAQLANHGCPDSVIKALEDADLLTFGQFTDWTKNGMRKPEDIPGIGAAKAETLLDSMTSFWSAWAMGEQRKLDALAIEGAKAAEDARKRKIAEPAAYLDSPAGLVNLGVEATARAAANLLETAKTVHSADDSGGPGVVEVKKSRKRKAG